MKVSGERVNDRIRPGMTLIEMSLVILVILGLIGVSFASMGSIGDWQKAKEVSSILREVEVAQRQYLSDHPQQSVATLTDAQVAAYLPGSPTVLPTMVGLDDIVLTVNVRVSPPVALNGTDVYDPTNSSSDGLWDVGK
jgi:type II secretory pathway pseudopilin PulG